MQENFTQSGGVVKPPVHLSGAAESISLRRVSACYGNNVPAIKDISLSIAEGQHVAVLGPSGSGKTTLLRCISGRLPACEGCVSCAKDVAVIHQDLRLVRQRSTLKNVLHGSLARVALWRCLWRFPSEERKKALRMLERVGLAHKATAKVCELSGGEQRRVAIARALMQEPSVLLADEPTSSLDDVTARSIMKLICEIAKERNLTVMSVLHDYQIAKNFAERIVYLEHGAVTQDKTYTAARALPVEVKTRPAEAQALPASPAAQPAQGVNSSLMLLLLGSALACVFAWALQVISYSDIRGDGIVTRIAHFAGQLFPASWEEVKKIPWQTLAAALLETVRMALAGTFLGVIIAWPLAALAARNTGPRYLWRPVRFALNCVRTVPSLVWGLLFVAALGLGSTAGIFALVAYSVGYLGKFFYEAFEAVEPGPPDALGEIGASPLQRFFYAVSPASMPAILSSVVFMIEYNVRAASVLGIVDAGGIGFYIKEYIDFRYFPAVSASLLLILAVVLALDAISCRLRSYLVRVV